MRGHTSGAGVPSPGPGEWHLGADDQTVVDDYGNLVAVVGRPEDAGIVAAAPTLLRIQTLAWRGVFARSPTAA